MYGVVGDDSWVKPGQSDHFHWNLPQSVINVLAVSFPLVLKTLHTMVISSSSGKVVPLIDKYFSDSEMVLVKLSKAYISNSGVMFWKMLNWNTGGGVTGYAREQVTVKKEFSIVCSRQKSSPMK